jgi:hypothetical protein
MTMSEQRDMSGTLSRNRKRETDKQPEFRGSCVIDGIAYWISAWVKEGDDGRFFSLAFTPKEKPNRSPAGVHGPGTRPSPWGARRRNERKLAKVRRRLDRVLAGLLRTKVRLSCTGNIRQLSGVKRTCSRHAMLGSSEFDPRRTSSARSPH